VRASAYARDARTNARHTLAARALYNVVVARSNLLRVFEVRADAPPLAPDAADGRDGVRMGTEAVEGEVAMDEGGEGFVNIGGGKVGACACRLLSVPNAKILQLMRKLVWCSLKARELARERASTLFASTACMASSLGSSACGHWRA
jgi:hypothetical protein